MKKKKKRQKYKRSQNSSTKLTVGIHMVELLGGLGLWNIFSVPKEQNPLGMLGEKADSWAPSPRNGSSGLETNLNLYLGK